MDLISTFSFFHYLALVIGSFALFKAFQAIYTFVSISFTLLNSKWAAKYGHGSWAIVTGCTEGIGKAFCFQLASLGFNLVLISRNESKLQALNKELWQKHSDLNTIICQIDFSTYKRQLYDKIMSKISHIDISILVNNVAVSHIKRFDQQTLKDVQEQINVNVCSMTFLTHKIVPLLLQRKQKCAIINLSSQSINYSLKTLSVYTATKAFNSLFSQCISQDYKGVIDILNCIPAIVSTAGTNYTKDPMACSSEECARWSLKALGKTSNTAGHWKHIVQSWFTLIIGQKITRWLAYKKMGDVAYKKE